MLETSLSSSQQPVLSFLAYGPLKFRGVMQTLLGRSIKLIDLKTVFRGGYELVVVDPMVISDDEKSPEYALNPKDYGVVTLTRYSNLKPDDIDAINQFLRVGTITDARVEVAELIGDKTTDLVHHLRPGIAFSPVDFGSRKNHDPIYREIELNEIQPVKYLKRARELQTEFGIRQTMHEGSALPLQSRK